RELGHPPAPVATIVHDLQVVASVPRDPTDQPLSVIATPTHAIRITRPSAAPTRIDWTRLTAEHLEEMPILAELKRMRRSRLKSQPAMRLSSFSAQHLRDAAGIPGHRTSARR